MQSPQIDERNLVVCIDGTSNKFGRKNTNVVKLYAHIKLDTKAGSDTLQWAARHSDGVGTHARNGESDTEAGSDRPPTEQHAYYSSGIGTHAKNLPFLLRVEKVISDWFDIALAWNVEENVKDAYGWLARKYRPGDKIYLFGFSRGAYQVRVLASLIHEVGLIRTPTEKQIEMAFGHYRSIQPHQPETREAATEFKKIYCWPDVRIYFVGVWDTVSSIGLIKGDVFVSTSASVTNALHFRHALALDERRVKFMPEYFQEMNAHRHNVLRPNPDGDLDILEVWFPGCHADVGGVSRLGEPYHVGNISLSWMQDEASKHGLRLKPANLPCTLEDVRYGRCDSLKIGWILLEAIFPFRHQVSFSGAGKNMLKWHRFRSRRIIPGQRIHTSAWCGDAYRPSATLGNSLKIPTILEGSFERTMHARPLDRELGQMVLAWAQRYAAHRLEGILKSSIGILAAAPDSTGWSRYIEDQQSDFDKFVAISACILVFDTAGENWRERIRVAKQCLQHILSDSQHPDLIRALSLLPLTIESRTLRQEMVATPEVTSVLIRVLQSSSENPDDNSLPLVVDSICRLLQTEEGNVMAVQLTVEPVAQEANGPAIFSRLLGTNDPNQVLAALRIIVLLPVAHINGDYICQKLKAKVKKLAKQGKGSVGLMAVSAFKVLREPNDQACDLNFSNILAYLGSGLMLDAEGDSDFSLADCRDLPPLAIGDFPVDERTIDKILSAIKSYNAEERMAATLTFLKLCRYPGIRHHLFGRPALYNFITQLKRKEASLLAAYALMTCLKYDLWWSEGLKIETLNDIAPFIVTMLKRGWFDDAVGLVEGFDIFRQLMEHETLRSKTEDGIYNSLKRKLESYEHDGVRTSLLCIDILDRASAIAPAEPAMPDNIETRSLVMPLVKYCLDCLKNEPWPNQRKGIKILSALSQTAAGQEAISPRIDEIIGILLPEVYGQGEVASRRTRRIPPSQMLGPCHALYSLSRNNSIRKKIQESERYTTLKARYLSGSFVNGPDTPPWRVRTPNKSDVLIMTARMIKVVDEGFSYDGIGSIPEAPLVVIWHISSLGILLRDTAVRAVQLLPNLAVGFVHGAIAIISRGADRIRPVVVTQTSPDEADAQELVPTSHLQEGIGGTSHQDGDPAAHLKQGQVPPFANISPNPVLQLPRSGDQPDGLGETRNHTQETVSADSMTRTTPQSPPVEICDKSNDSRSPPPLQGNDDHQIIEVLREAKSVMFVTPAQPEIEPGLHEGRQYMSDSPITPPRQPEPQIVEYLGTQAEEVLSSASQHAPFGLIALKDFTACDLPTKKFLKLISPRARLTVRVGERTFQSSSVKIGNQPAGEMRSRTRWKWFKDFPQANPLNDERFEILIERKFFLKYTCIRRTVTTNARAIKEDQRGRYSALPLYKEVQNEN